MRVLIFTHYFAPDSGAAAVRLSRLAKLLHQRSHTISVMTTMPHYPKGRIAEAYRGKLASTENWHDIDVNRSWLWATPSPKIAFRLVSQLSFMVSAVLRSLTIPKPEIVLIEAQPIFTAVAGVVYAKLKRTRYVMNVSDFWPEYLTAVGVLSETHPLYQLFMWLINWTYRGADAIITMYPTLIEGIEARTGRTGKTTNIYNGVDLTVFRPDLDVTPFVEKHGLANKKLVTFVGTFGSHIDFKTMLDAAALLSSRADIKFVLIGTGAQNEALKQRLNEDDLSKVVHIGWVDHSEVPLAWAASYLTFWAIRNHSLYRQILQSKMYEAMASGVPLAIATEGLTAEILHASGSGLTAQFEDSQGLADAITTIVDDVSLREKMSKRARLYAEQHFDALKVAERYEEILLNARSG